VATDASFRIPERIDLADVLRVHEAGYVDRLVNGTLAQSEIRRMELPYSKELVEATLLGCGGTLLAGRLALVNGISISIGGGFHHAHPDHGEGFCMLHDVAIALRRMLDDGAIRRALVIDLDVHHGNGTAAIFPPASSATNTALHEVFTAGVLTGPGAASSDGVFTVSLHQRKIYPAYKPPSSIDVHLDDDVEDRDYLEALARTLDLAFERFTPEIIAYVAGSDPYRDDKLGSLSLSIEGLRRRDELVFRTAHQHNIPIFSVFAGGYARQLEDTVTIHTNTVLAAMDVIAAVASEARPARE
jgi:acetoin utilization deacetylase AcuC-like enzyme